jgi:transposase
LTNGSAGTTRKIGRPTKLHDVIIRRRNKVNAKGEPTGETESYEITIEDAILELVRQGNYQETAAAFAGLGERTFYTWVEKGDPEGTDPDNEAYRQFGQALKRARAEAEARDLALITEAAGDGNWQAAAWKRERMDPARFGRREQLVIRQELAVQIAADVLELTRLALERHIPDPEKRRAVLADIVEGGMAVERSLAGSAAESRAQRPS